MDKSDIIRPSPWCQEELWRLVHWFEENVNRINTPWFSASIKLVVADDSVTLHSEELDGSIELRKNVVRIDSKEIWRSVVIVKTTPCILFVEKDRIELYECAVGKDGTGYESGTWIWFNRDIAPFHYAEYIYAEEMYKRLRHIFKVLAGFITDKLSP